MTWTHDYYGELHCNECQQRYEDGLVAYFDDEREIRADHWTVGSGEVVIDVGCAEGNYTLPALLAGARVYAVDPSAERLEGLKRCVGTAGLLTTVNQALFDGGEYPEDLLDRHLAAAADSDFSTLDGLVVRFRLKRLDWVKVDVEGAELGVLRGGVQSLERFRPRLLVENHRRDSRKMARLLRKLGYAIERIPYTGPTSERRWIWVCSP